MEFYDKVLLIPKRVLLNSFPIDIYTLAFVVLVYCPCVCLGSDFAYPFDEYVTNKYFTSENMKTNSSKIL